jgi:hypothetical protein
MCENSAEMKNMTHSKVESMSFYNAKITHFNLMHGWEIDFIRGPNGIISKLPRAGEPKDNKSAENIVKQISTNTLIQQNL